MKFKTSLLDIEANICNDPTHNKNLCRPKRTDIIPHPDGLGVAFLEAMKRNSGKIAQIDSITGNKETYDEMLSKCIRIAQNLEVKGLVQGDVVMFCSMNNLEIYSCAVATFMAGAILSAIDPILSLRESVHLLKMIQPKYIFCDKPGLELLEIALEKAEVKAQIIYYGETEKYIPFSEMLISQGDENNFEAKKVSDLNDTAVIYFSSGTTGLPKGIATRHYSILSGSMQLDLGMTFYVVTRMCWLSATMFIAQYIMAGSSWVLSHEYNTKDFYRIISEYKVECLIAPPIYAHELTKYAEFNNYDLSVLKIFAVVGGVISAEQILKLRNLFPSALVCSGYGLTETTGGFIQHSLENIELSIEKVSSIGCVTKGNCVKVVDVETEKAVGPYVHGEIRVKSDYIMNGYYKNPDATTAAIDSEGYFCTGDVGYYDDDYYFYIVDRLKDMMKFRSFYVAPGELEQLILTHPEVIDAVVIPLPHEEDIDHPMALVKVFDNSKVTPEELQKFVNDLVDADYKKLRGGVKFVDNIPKTGTFKQRRMEIRTMFLKNKK